MRRKDEGYKDTGDTEGYKGIQRDIKEYKRDTTLCTSSMLPTSITVSC